MRWIACVALLAGLGVPAGPGDATPSGCEQAKRTNGWCKAGNVGYVASLPIRSKFLYEVLDAHSHNINAAAVTCETCRKALKTNGYCPAHKMGYVGGNAYMSRLTYYLARGRRIDPATIACPVCREHTRGIGWCDRHQLGIAGYTATDDRHDFDELSKAYQILVEAIKMSATCERCAGAMVADGYCAIHHTKYENGRLVPGFGEETRQPTGLR